VAGIPSDDREWLELVRAGQAPYWKLLAEASDGFVVTDGDVMGAVIPAAPERSVFNSVFYESADALLGSLDRLAAAYEKAGVRAWTVWVPEDDREVAQALATAGHVLDANPRAMGRTLESLPSEPDPADGVEVIQDDEDISTLARLNEIAYGDQPGTYSAVMREPIPGTRLYFARLDGEAVACVGTWDHGDDCEILWVATTPVARGRGLSKLLMVRAMAEARDRGCLTTTLQATRLGSPVYLAVGYRDVGALQMWERRRSGP
jgi:GNAT superfamily N-acetyltransferase